MVHNHPSGELVPSRQDVLITHRILELTELMGIRLADHVIVGGDNSQYFSFSEKSCYSIPHFLLLRIIMNWILGKRQWWQKKGKQGEAMEERRSFTAEELALAKSVDLTAVAASLGYTVKKIGRYHTLKEMDSIRIYNRTNWFRWSREHDRGNNGGSQIDFLRVFAGMEVKDAVFWLLDFSGYRRDGDWEKKSANVYVEKIEGKHSTEEKKKPFVLPARAKNNDYLYSYLTGDRGA